MKIARIIYEWPPPWIGLAPAPFELTRSQVKVGHEIEVFCGRWPNAGDIERVDNTEFHTFWRAPLEGTISITTSIVLFLKYIKLRKLGKQFDMIHSHGHFGLWIYVYRKILLKHFPWAKELKTPLVVHFHNTVKGRKEKLKENGTPIKPISQYLDWPLAELADRTAVRIADAMIFVSEDLKKEAIEHYKADPSKCFVIESGVDPEKFKRAGPDEIAKTRIELELESSDKIILNIGFMVERKNIHTIIESLTLLPRNYKLMLIGEGEDEYLDRLDALIKDNHLENRVLRVGYTPYPQLQIAYQAADLFILPSSFEGMPKVVMEALATGTQVLGSGFKLNDPIDGLEYLDEITPEKIASKIADMIQHPRRVDVRKVVVQHSWDVKAHQVDQVYDFVKKNTS